MHRISPAQVRSLSWKTWSWKNTLCRACQSTGVLLGLVVMGGQVALAQSPSGSGGNSRSTAVPTQLQEALASLDQVASQENLPGVLQYYSSEFTDGDGLNRESWETILSDFWNRYQDLTYTTSILSASETPQGWVLETTLRIKGTEVSDDRSLYLESEIRARQIWQNNQLIYQEILAERNTVTSGDAPPSISVHLPETVQVNERFNFDVIIEEPVKEDLVLGAIVDEPISSDHYLSPAIPEFQPLVSGGIFKVGQAPSQPDNRWISAVIIRKGGMTLVTQRLRILAN
ncbi:MAG: nuclear transport factor 2 family protein [Prochlorotrichaceae cyanobacterium]